MSRYVDNDDYENPSRYLWHSNLRRALKSKRGQKALTEFREALLALPKRELIEGAMCTMNSQRRIPTEGSKWWVESTKGEIIAKGEGVCAVGAYAWYKLVQSGVDPVAAFDQIPTMLDSDGNALWDTAEYARQKFDMAITLAWEIAYQNDEALDNNTPAARWKNMLGWIEDQLIEPVESPVWAVS